jgi:hypothetical protein
LCIDNISSAIIRFNAYSLNEAKLRQGLAKVDNVVFCTGFNSNTEGEGFDRPFALLRYQELFIKKIASMHPNVVVVLNAGGGVDFTNWYDAAKAILMAWYPGQEGGQAIAEILTGKISPSGKLPIYIKQRQAEGIAAAKARGVKFGRPPLPIPENFYQMHKDWRAGKITIEEAAKACNMCPKTFYSKAVKYEKSS